jgi:ammonium transporter, Amt family
MDTATLLSNLWLMICTALVFFMQAGFCCLEAGTVRSKNSINVALKNVVTFLVAGGSFYVIGYALMFGLPWVEQFIGMPLPFLKGIGPQETFTFLYQLVFCTTAATIVSGAMAERLRFLPYILGTVGLSIIIYPLFGYWAWNANGWLHQMGYHDFAGSSVVHMLGGFVSLAGIQKLGARKGRFDIQGRPVEVAASDVPMVALGVFILFFGWIGFNGGSAPFGPQTAGIVLNTVLGGVFGGLTCLLVGWALQGISGASTIMNGLLAGLVAITAGADIVSHQAAALIGAGGGLAYMALEKILLRFQLDDAVGAVPVHAGAGIAGIVLTGIFAKASYIAETEKILGHEFSRFNMIGIQCLGAIVCATWAYLIGFIMWRVIGKITVLRVTEAEEIVGLNYSEHQVRSPVEEVASYMEGRAAKREGIIRPENADEGEYARLFFVMEKWAQNLDKERQSLENIRGWLHQDADKIYDIIQRCEMENLLQSQRMDTVTKKIDRVHQDLLHRPTRAIGQLHSNLALDVLENVQEKLTEVKAGGGTITFYWEQLRILGTSLLKHTRALPTNPVQVSP